MLLSKTIGIQIVENITVEAKFLNRRLDCFTDQVKTRAKNEWEEIFCSTLK